jgi:hypothetical protein
MGLIGFFLQILPKKGKCQLIFYAIDKNITQPDYIHISRSINIMRYLYKLEFLYITQSSTCAQRLQKSQRFKNAILTNLLKGRSKAPCTRKCILTSKKLYARTQRFALNSGISIYNI